MLGTVQNTLLTLFALAATLLAGQCRAGAVVLQNRAAVKIDYVVRQPDGKEVRRTVLPGDVASISATSTLAITLGVGQASASYLLPVNSIHFLGVREGTPELVHLKLPGIDDKEKPADATPPSQTPPVLATAGPPTQVEPIYKIPVMLLVDADDPRQQSIWEKKLRKRLEDASDIFEHHCRVRFEVVACGTWPSDAKIRVFDQSLAEFEGKVRPFPARLAIGFTSHYDWAAGETHLGATHGALSTHILIRETVGRVSEAERLEVLVHELGHFLGASHTADRVSVMRPKLGDQQSHAKDFRVGFDAGNTLVMYLMAEEMRTRHIWHPSLLSTSSKDALRGAYTALGQTIPGDKVAAQAIEMLGPPPPPPRPPGSPSLELVQGAHFVVQAITQAARENQKLPFKAKDPRAAIWQSDDELTALYVRRAAAAARQLAPHVGRAAFLLGIGVGLDDSNYVRDKPLLNEIWKQVESSSEREGRLLALGTPTMRKRHDSAQHFAISSALVALSGPQVAEAAGFGKEMLDSRGGSGFSFADLCADLAGVKFASQVGDGKLSLDKIAQSFTVPDYMPKMDGLPEDIQFDEFLRQYGASGSERFMTQRNEITQRIEALAGYKAAEKTIRAATPARQ